MPKFAFTLSRAFEKQARIIISADDAATAFELISELDLDAFKLPWRDHQIGGTDLIGPTTVNDRYKITPDIQRRIDAIAAKWAALEKKEKEKHERSARRNRTRVRR